MSEINLSNEKSLDNTLKRFLMTSNESCYLGQAKDNRNRKQMSRLRNQADLFTGTGLSPS